MEIKRLVSKNIQKALDNIGAVLVTGPKFCGKTFISEKFAKSQIYINHNVIHDIERLGDKVFLNGETPRLIDEWQLYPHIWDSVRHEIDKHKDNNVGLYLLTGSTKPFNNGILEHSGAGRIARLKMQTLTFYEILSLPDESTISLLDLFDHKPLKDITNPYDIDVVDEMMIKGGWPSIISNQDKDYRFLIEKYIDAITNISTKDEQESGYIFRKNPTQLSHLLKSLARLSTAQINKSTIIKDFGEDINIATIDKYINMLYDTDVIFDVPVWRNSNIRSSYTLRTKPKTYFCDTSLVCNLLGISNVDDFYKDGNTTGIIFETQVIKDLMVYAQYIGAKLYFYRDSNGNEIDAILEMNDGRWAAIEIKLSLTVALKASENLLKVIDTLNVGGTKSKPEFTLIIANCDQCYQDKNGVYIIPHTLLRP